MLQIDTPNPTTAVTRGKMLYCNQCVTLHSARVLCKVDERTHLVR